MAEAFTKAQFVRLLFDEATDAYKSLIRSGNVEQAKALRLAYLEANLVELGEPTEADFGSSSAPMTILARHLDGGPRDAFVACGWILLTIGFCVALGAFFYDPSVANSFSSADASSLGISMPERVVNNGKLNVQLMLCMLGCSSMIVGATFLSRPTSSNSPK